MKVRKSASVWVVRAASTVFLLALVTAGLYQGAWWVMRAKFTPQPPAKDFPEPRDALQAQRQDVAYFAELMALDRSFSDEARAEADWRIAELLALDAPLHPAKLRVALHQISALADNGHTRVVSWIRRGRPNELPLRVIYFPDGLYVVRVKGEALKRFLGARVEEIDGYPVGNVMSRVESLNGGGTKERRAIEATGLIISPEILFGLDIAPSAERSTWRFRLSDGNEVTHTFEAYVHGDDDPGFDPSEAFSLEPPTSEGESTEWRTLSVRNGSTPIALRDFKEPFRRLRLDNSCAAVVQFKAMYDAEGMNLADFLEATEEDFERDAPCALVLDFRFNGGGDYTKVYPFTQRLPELLAPDAQVYILTSPITFSAAITTTVFVKQTLPSRVTIIGEPVGDRLRFWAEGGSGCLPNAGYCVTYTAGLHDYQNPCWDWDKCFWLNWYYRPRVGTLEPDVPIQMYFSDYVAGRDPVFERAAALASRSNS